MKYMIEFELPDNDTVQREIKTAEVAWGVWGYRGCTKARPVQGWIPCSETVDIPDHEILACDKYGEEMFGYLVYEDEQWLCESYGGVMCDPIAWREKPEPYRGEGEQE